VILFLLKYRKWIGYGLAVVLLVGLFLAYRHSLIEMGDKRGAARIQALWDRDTAKRDTLEAKLIADAKARQAATEANNAKVLQDATQALVSIADQRDDTERLLQSARDQVRSLSASQATSQRGADVAARIAASAAEVDRRLADYDAACSRDSVRLKALQDQIRGQL
jgi:hypothetical protein